VTAAAISVVFFDLGGTLVTPARKSLPGAKQLLHGVKKAGLRTGIISNTAELSSRAEILKLLPPDFDLSVFETILTLFSSELHFEKPHSAIFADAVMRTGRLAKECLYCSEDIVECLMAQEVGMRSIRVQSPPNNDLSGLLQTMQQFQALRALS